MEEGANSPMWVSYEGAFRLCIMSVGCLGRRRCPVDNARWQGDGRRLDEDFDGSHLLRIDNILVIFSKSQSYT